MARHKISNEQWELIADEFGSAKSTGRPPVERRTVLNGIFWIMRTGSPWRDLPDEFGAWQTVWRLFNQWNGDGTLDKILTKLRQLDEINEELWCIDGTVVRAAKCAAGGGKKGIRRNPKTMRSGAVAAV